MATAVVHAPVKDYDGVVAGVQFKKGAAEVERGSAAHRYFRTSGYRIDGQGTAPAVPEPPDPRELGTDGDGVEVVGTRLRDAAVDPQPGDFLPPTNAGRENPHGPLVVSPGLHAAETGPIAPGPVPQVPAEQEAKEATLASAVFVDNTPVQDATAALARAEGVSPARTTPRGDGPDRSNEERASDDEREPDVDTDQDDDQPADDYEERTPADLREELTRRELPTSGSKAQMVARLRKADAAQEG